MRTRLSSFLTTARKILRDPSSLTHARELDRDFLAAKTSIGDFIGGGPPRSGDDKVALFISFTNLPVFAKLECLMAKSLQMRGYSPVFVTFSRSANALRYFELFGFDRFIFWDKLVKSDSYAPEGDYEQRARSEMPSMTVSAMKSFEYRGVPVGKQALSRGLRDMVQGRVDLADSAQSSLFYRELARAMQYTDVASDLVRNLSPAVCFVREFGYTPHAQPFAVAVNMGVPGVNWHPAQRSGTWVFKRHHDIADPKIHLSISDVTWSRLKREPWLPHQEELLNREFEGRYRPDSRHDTRCLQEGKRLKSKAEVQLQLGLDPAKKTAVIFSHITWDQAFFYGKDVFEDFEHWLLETVRAACRNDNLNWIIKLHPANVLKLKQKSGGREMSEMITLRRLGELPRHVKIVAPDTDINTWSLYQVADYGLTVRGSVGFELPCFGIPVLTAGTGGYSGFGFTIDCESQSEYFERMRTLHTVPRLAADQIELAKKHAYYLWVERQISFDDVALVTHLPTKKARHPLQTNAELRLTSLEDIEMSPSLTAFADWIDRDSSPDLLTAPDHVLSCAATA